MFGVYIIVILKLLNFFLIKLCQQNKLMNFVFKINNII